MWARALFNGSLAKHTQLNAVYIIRHPDIAAVADPGLYDPKNQGDLTEIGYLLMMKDITQKVQTIVEPCTVVLACRRQLMTMNNAIQEAHCRQENTM